MNTISSFKPYSTYNPPVKNSFGQKQQVVSTPTQKVQNTQSLQSTQDLKRFTKIIFNVLMVECGILLLSLAALGILTNAKRKVGKFAEHVDFKPAKTLKEAVDFGKKNFGIKKYKSFEDIDLDVVNWVNEGLTNVNNLTHGNVAMPRKVWYVSSDEFSGTMNEFGTLQISKDFVKNTRDTVNNHYEAFYSEQGFSKPENFTETKKLFKTFDSIYSVSYKSTFDVINHEMGHLQHSANNYNISLNEIDKKYADIFKKSENIVGTVSKYAKKSPSEFVAECYCVMVDEKLSGKTILSDEVRQLYKKLGGADI